MNTRFLRYFVACVENHTMLAAAEAVHISQPALSKAISTLEQELGVTLLDRHPRSVVPTPFGQTLFRYAKMIDADMRRAVAEIDAQRGMTRGTIVVGVIPTMTEMMGRVALAVMQLYPGLRLKLRVAFSSELTRSLLDGELDCAILLIPAEEQSPGLAFDPLLRTGPVVAVRADHPLTRQARSSVGDLAANNSHSVESWAPVGATGWRVQVTTPARAFSAPVRNAALSLSAAVALCVVLLLLLARLLIAELKQVRQREAAQLQSQRMEALGRLTGGVAHDFNNLLTPIVGGLDLIGRRVSDERTLRYVEAAAMSAERARTLVSRLLSFSRRQTLAPEPVDLHRLLHGMSDLIDRSLTPAIQCEVSVASDLCSVHADRGQLELAILNLIINARDAMPDGGSVRVTAGMASAEEAPGMPGGPAVFVAVTDTGIGMDARTMAQATEPFFTIKASERGTGLGLSMVHGFAAQSGGSFHLASAPNRGTVATLVLPCSADTSTREITATGMSPTAPARILLVDDEPDVRRVTADMLTDAGHDVRETSSVREALAVLRTDPSIRLVITDYVMPAQSGGDLINEMRTTGPLLPVLLVTGFVTDGQELPHDLPKLMKPFSRAELLRALGRLLPTERRGGTNS